MKISPKLHRILLVDDSFDDNFFHRRILKKMEVAESIDVASDGQQALDYLTCQGKFQDDSATFPQPELIFLDINMPRMDWWTFLKEYDQLPPEQQGKRVIIMLTTSLNPDDHHKAQEMPSIQFFLTKPLRPDMVERILEQFFPERIV
ncbi:MAG: response regulator [Bacteroidota bacterium]